MTYINTSSVRFMPTEFDITGWHWQHVSYLMNDQGRSAGNARI